MSWDLALFLARFKFPDRVLCHDFVSGEAFCEVEDFYLVSKHDNDPIVQNMQVDYLHIRTKLHRAHDLLAFVVPKTEPCAWELDMRASTNEEEDVRVFVRIT